MSRPRVARVTFAVFLITALSFLATMNVAYGMPAVVLVEYFYVKGCGLCEQVGPLIESLRLEYVERAEVVWVDVGTPDGFSRWQSYNLTSVPAVVINHEYKLIGREITLQNLRAAVETYLYGVTSPITGEKLQVITPWTAFSLGVFSGFSPCNMTILAFILATSVAKSKRLLTGLGRATVFGLGLMDAYIVLGFALLLFQSPLSAFTQYGRVLRVGFAFLFTLMGLNIIGVLRIPFSTKPLLRRLAETHGLSLVGLFFLGFLFALINPCATPLLLVLLSKLILSGSTGEFYPLVLFGLGVLLPFMGVGLVGGSPRLARRIQEKYKKWFRIFAGLILVATGLWFLI